MNIETNLSGVAAKLAIDAIYYLARLVRHRALSAIPGSKILVEGLPNEPSPEAEKLALSIAKSIEQKSGKPLDELDEKAVKELMDQLENSIRQKYTGGKEINSRRGDELLQELRNESKL